MSRPPHDQLDLFGVAAEPAQSHAVAPAEVPEALAECAQQIPPGIFLGTSSWHFPGWARLVYDRVMDERTLAREGLEAYAQHPLLKSVGIDRTFYAPIPRAEYAHYAQQVPGHFRFLVKAPMACTAPTLRAEPPTRGAANPHFLDPVHAAEHFVLPCLEGLGAKAGPLANRGGPPALPGWQ